MKPIASRLALVLSDMILLAVLVVLATGHSEDCSPPVIPASPASAVAAAGTPTPTLAPQHRLVFVRVESDKPDIQVGWAEE
jgi:hypothetical protein